MTHRILIGARAMYNDLEYPPFGILSAQADRTGVKNISFAGSNEDTTTSLYDAKFREYGIQGRWLSPDQAGIAPPIRNLGTATPTC